MLRSFVKRQGHLSPGRREALTMGQALQVKAENNTIWAFSDLFKRSAPVLVEIGFGMGASFLTTVRAHPEWNHLGLEVHTPGVANVLRMVMAEDLSHVRVCQQDAIRVLQQAVPLASVSRVHIFFPDPWPKARHQKRRLVQAPFVSMAAARLLPGGIFHMATDWEPYARAVLAVLEAEPLLENVMPCGQFANGADWRPETKYEQRGRALGHGVWDLVFRRKVL